MTTLYDLRRFTPETPIPRRAPACQHCGRQDFFPLYVDGVCESPPCMYARTKARADAIAAKVSG